MYYNPMKRFIFICLFSVIGFAFAQTAESQTHFKNGLSLGAFWAFNQDKSGVYSSKPQYTLLYSIPLLLPVHFFREYILLLTKVLFCGRLFL